jgi:hypothetical protein
LRQCIEAAGTDTFREHAEQKNSTGAVVSSIGVGGRIAAPFNGWSTPQLGQRAKGTQGITTDMTWSPDR